MEVLPSSRWNPRNNAIAYVAFYRKKARHCDFG